MARKREREVVLVTADEARRIWLYDPETGALHWRIAPTSRIPAGSLAGGSMNGYLTVKYRRVLYYQHRIAFLIMVGRWPDPECDHKDLCRSNNRWANLREATCAQNHANKVILRNNACGVKGVRRAGKRWRAQITTNGVTVHIGTFDRKEDAGAAYAAAAERIHGEFARA